VTRGERFECERRSRDKTRRVGLVRTVGAIARRPAGAQALVYAKRRRLRVSAPVASGGIGSRRPTLVGHLYGTDAMRRTPGRVDAGIHKERSE
jgi:hypothetical protein